MISLITDIKDIKALSRPPQIRLALRTSASISRTGSMFGDVALKCRSNSIKEETLFTRPAVISAEDCSPAQYVEEEEEEKEETIVDNSWENISVFKQPSFVDQQSSTFDNSLIYDSNTSEVSQEDAGYGDNSIKYANNYEVSAGSRKISSDGQTCCDFSQVPPSGIPSSRSSFGVLRNCIVNGVLNKKSVSSSGKSHENGTFPPNNKTDQCQGNIGKQITAEQEIPGCSEHHGPIVAKIKPSIKRRILDQILSKQQQEKRINRLDLRLRIIIRSAFNTLLMVTQFIICYMLWWLLSIDILYRSGDKFLLPAFLQNITDNLVFVTPPPGRILGNTIRSRF